MKGTAISYNLRGRRTLFSSFVLCCRATARVAPTDKSFPCRSWVQSYALFCVKTVFQPSDRVRVDIIPDFPEIKIVSDNMFIIPTLPEFSFQAQLPASVCREGFQCAHYPPERRGDPCGRLRLIYQADEMNVIRHNNIRINRHIIAVFNLMQHLYDGLPVWRRCHRRATARVAPTDFGENAAPILRADRDEICALTAVIICGQAKILPLWILHPLPHLFSDWATLAVARNCLNTA